MPQIRTARFAVGQAVRHCDDAFNGVVMDVDPGYAGPAVDLGVLQADQPFYRVFALGDDGGFIAYAAESSLEAGDLALDPGEIARWFATDAQGHHAPLDAGLH
ncbi:heat shock protein HspQ [Brevundimonas sp. SORGH_AS_0993]|uniref:heat shock protein HspQ n=1 Tax=Brevundimonas sp. SORGH_AS_0993 TaxID=3041794 RepID=UPI0027856BA5|nr:heat shock protein HspQ [Brevundimonas sp. SORGH_AS_0993]MDQ1153989.1 heat shock protein HspQ [Brevundimonas sp. SORGH_AS_0993]